MKKVLVIVLLIIAGCVLALVRRNPNAILEDHIFHKFGFSLRNLHPKTISFNEEWQPNGDGYSAIIFEYNPTNYNFGSFENLPIKKNLPPCEIPETFKNAEQGYYLLKIDSIDWRNFDIILLDSDSKKGILYYQLY